MTEETRPDAKEALPELLHCPFCGGNPEYSDPIMIGVAYYNITCSSCRVKTGRYNSRNQVAIIWNTRKGQHEYILQLVRQAVEEESWIWGYTNPVTGALLNILSRIEAKTKEEL